MKLLFRTDASVSMGTGHVMRCLALAQAWQDAGGEVVFAMAEATPSIEARLRIERAQVVRLQVAAGSADDAACTLDAAQRHRAGWVVVDGYQFDSGYASLLQSGRLKVLQIDDNGEAGPYSADLVLNQNLHASEGLYRYRAPQTRVLLGTRYVLLRREFAFWRKRTFEISGRARRVLLTMGGSDPDNVTEQILRFLLVEPDLELTVAVGGSNPHLASIEKLVEQASGPVRVLKDVSNMPALMVWADLAVAGAGTTSWEMCMMGLPAALCVLAPNQENIAAELARAGAAVNLGYVGRNGTRELETVLRQLIDSQSARAKMSARGRELVDGRGAERVVAFLWEDPVLRRTVDSDCRCFWEWANDPGAQADHFTRDPIPWERHMEWFRSRMADPKCILYTAVNRAGDPIGMVRYQLNGAHAVLSISLGAPFRGKGNGRRMLAQATAELFQNSGATAIDAFVRLSNQSSIRLFEGAGFRNIGTQTVHGDEAIHFVLEKGVLT
ncbi:MAG TPA: UDP-2,4-diacetamido-2,4,6-trideoxy-beta-L-altropyranose hydrolase [Terriglobales bacterium]|nr:UDP-2,4-diacetamido-2,4,6-trideoxy-beta-L-altropyranose hydrolase [Terriglobales bacterium]